MEQITKNRVPLRLSVYAAALAVAAFVFHRMRKKHAASGTVDQHSQFSAAHLRPAYAHMLKQSRILVFGDDSRTKTSTGADAEADAQAEAEALANELESALQQTFAREGQPLVLGFDAEWCAHKHASVAVIQISTGKTTFVIRLCKRVASSRNADTVALASGETKTQTATKRKPRKGTHKHSRPGRKRKDAQTNAQTHHTPHTEHTEPVFADYMLKALPPTLKDVLENPRILKVCV